MWAPCPRQLFDNLDYFQGFDDVKIYYDNGQRTIAHALHRAMDFALAKNAVVYRAAVPENYRLSQAADYICTMELVVLRYRDGEPSATALTRSSSAHGPSSRRVS